MPQSRKIGVILDGITPRWDVYQEDPPDGLVTVEYDAANGEDDDVFACLDDFMESIAPGFSYQPAEVTHAGQ